MVQKILPNVKCFISLQIIQYLYFLYILSFYMKVWIQFKNVHKLNHAFIYSFSVSISL